MVRDILTLNTVREQAKRLKISLGCVPKTSSITVQELVQKLHKQKLETKKEKETMNLVSFPTVHRLTESQNTKLGEASEDCKSDSHYQSQNKDASLSRRTKHLTRYAKHNEQKTLPYRYENI